MKKKRTSIPKIIKESIKARQNNRCACCIEIGREFHHVNPVCLSGKNSHNNLVLLCQDCHSLVHLGDLQTCLTILEYVYYLYNGKLPSDLLNDLMCLSEIIKEDYDGDLSNM